MNSVFVAVQYWSLNRQVRPCSKLRTVEMKTKENQTKHTFVMSPNYLIGT